MSTIYLGLPRFRGRLEADKLLVIGKRRKVMPVGLSRDGTSLWIR